MNNIKIAHESPLILMNHVREMTDYDYALVHLFLNKEFGEKYFNFFKDSLKLGREVILDNSAYELGDAFDIDIYREWVIKLKPTYYIIPDCPGNKDETLLRARKWIEKIQDYPELKELKTIGVVQGSTYEEVVESYNFWKDHCDKIAFTFYYPFYDGLSYSDSRVESNMRCRQNLLLSFVDNNIIDITKKHHLLGTWLPQEFTFYRDNFEKFKWIDSVDSSNPVLHGIEREKYTESGLDHKSTIKMESLMNKEIDTDQQNIVVYNINKFKEFVRG